MSKKDDDDINGQVSADLEFTRRAEELLSKLRRGKSPTGPSEEEEKEKEREKERNSTKHK